MLELLRTLSDGREFAPFGEFASDVARPLLGWAPSVAGPRADVHETPDALRVVLDLPGYAGDTIAIQFEKAVLTVEAERKRDDDVGKTLLVGERGFGKVRRAFALNVPVDAERIAADFKDGVLTVTLPKRAEARTRKIEVKVG